MFEVMTQPPPWPVSAMISLFSVATSLALAAAVMVQWVGWMALGTAIWNPWGIALGIIISSAQIVALFLRGRVVSVSCEISKKPETV